MSTITRPSKQLRKSTLQPWRSQHEARHGGGTLAANAATVSFMPLLSAGSD